jgi:hypothetical protein
MNLGWREQDWFEYKNARIEKKLYDRWFRVVRILSAVKRRPRLNRAAEGYVRAMKGLSEKSEEERPG